MSHPLKRLTLDYWCKPMIIISFTFLLLSLTAELYVDNHVVQMLALGALLLSLGEWANHPLQTTLVNRPPFAGQAEGHPRRNCVAGVVMVTAGFLLLAAGIGRLVWVVV